VAPGAAAASARLEFRDELPPLTRQRFCERGGEASLLAREPLVDGGGQTLPFAL
jgi:hypothetical protein